MSFDNQYASIYDALYHDKDYARESAFVEKLLAKYSNGTAHRILDLGCGTGRHAVALAERGHTVYGVDVSAQMLRQAEERRAQLPFPIRNMLSFELADIRTLDLRQQFDSVISLFHVMNYQTTDQDLIAALTVARKHLRRDGLFLFDFWHGPAVLSEGPTRRVKRVESGTLRATRRANPVWDREHDIVKVIYDVEITDVVSSRTETVQEEHVVRYFFRDWVARMAERCGFVILEDGEWLTGRPPSEDVFSVYAIARAQ